MLAGMLLAYAFETLPGGVPHDHGPPTSAFEPPFATPPAASGSTLVLPKHPMMMQQPYGMHPMPMPMHPYGTQPMQPYGMPIMGCAFGADDFVLMAVPSAPSAPNPTAPTTTPASASGDAAVDAKMGKTEIASTTSAVESIESGCVAHSVILGLSLGLQQSLSTATNLLIVFLLHQLLEAICLSHLIASLKRRCEAFFMCALTVASMPVGIAVGIIIEQSANGELLAPYTHTHTSYVCVYLTPCVLIWNQTKKIRSQHSRQHGASDLWDRVYCRRHAPLLVARQHHC